MWYAYNMFLDWMEAADVASNDGEWNIQAYCWEQAEFWYNEYESYYFLP